MAHSSPEPHAPQQADVARVVPKRVVIGKNGGKDPQAGPSLEIFLQPNESLILLPEAGVHGRKMHCGRLASGVSLFQLSQQRHSLSTLPQNSITVAEVTQGLACSPRQFDAFLQLCDYLLL